MKKHILNSSSDVLVLKNSRNKQIEIPEKLINLNRATSYYNNFYNTRLANDRSDESRAVWFELKMLQEYFNRANNFCASQNIEISRFVFLLGATENGERNVLIAPATYDERLDLHRAFSLDNNEITYLHRFPGENYSTIKDFTRLKSTEQSLVLSTKGLVSSAEAVTQYNNYFDTILSPLASAIPLDTRFVYYEVSEFEAYLTYLKTQAKENNINISGINAIFGAKDNTENEGMFANLVTLFFAPTAEGLKNISISSFDAPQKNLLALTKTEWESTLEEGLITAMFNFGQGGPPPYGWD